MKDKGMTLAERQERAAIALANIKETTHGSTVFTGPAVEVARIFALIAALRMEVKGHQMSRTSAYQTVKSEFDFKGSKQKVLEQLMHYRFVNYPAAPIQVPCPECGVRALVKVRAEDGVDVSDGTAYLCHPMLKGCNTGFCDA